MKLVNSAGELTPVLKILTDYTRDDLAHDEVHQALVTACVRRGVPFANLDVGAIPGLDTVTAGFKTAQLMLNSGLGYGHIFHTNCAPRKNIVSVRSQGEKIVLGMTQNGTVLLAVNAGYTLAPFYESVQAGDMAFFQTSVPDSGSQFRSRDYFPDAMAELAAHLGAQMDVLGQDRIKALLQEKKFDQIFKGLSYVGEALKITALPQLPTGAVSYVDNFGNIKLNCRHAELLQHHPVGTTLVVSLGTTVSDAIVGDVGFSQGEGIIALTAGSSGWSVCEGEKKAFTEIFLRGGRAESMFKGFRTGDQVLAVRKDDLARVIDILREASREVSDKLDLYNISEARIIQLLAWARLIRDCFDTSELQKALVKGDLLQRLMD